MKLRACHDVSIEISEEPVDIRASPEVVGLSACLWWISMSMFGRPLQSTAGRWIAASGHRGPQHTEGGCFQAGQYLLTNVELCGDDYPHLLEHEEPSAVVMQEVYGVRSLQELRAILDRGRRQTAALARDRLPTHATAPPAHTLIEPLENIQSCVFPLLARAGVSFRADPDRPNITEETRHSLSQLMPNWSADCWVEGVMRMFCRTFWQKVPNQQRGPSWLKPEFLQIAYRNYGISEWRLPLSEVKQKFRAVKVKRSQTEWERAFGHCFPITPSRGGHNLSIQPCREEWLRVIQALSPANQQIVVDLIRAKFDTLTAAPDVRHDKWWTSTAIEGPTLLQNPYIMPCDHLSGYLTLAEMDVRRTRVV